MVKIGSARHDENGKYSGGHAGDQIGSEVSIQNFYVSSKGWDILRAKDASVAEKLAESMKTACGNPNIGYCQGHRNGVITYGINSNVPCECDCSSLLRACVIASTGKDPGNFTTATEKTALLKTDMFTFVGAYKNGMKIYKGDILVTHTKGHTVIVTDSDYDRNMIANSIPANTTPSIGGSWFSVGKKYTLQVRLKVRTGAGTNYPTKSHSQLTVDGQKHDKTNSGCLDAGTVVSCLEIASVGNDIWIRCPSGWIAAYYQGKEYIK